MLLLAILGYYKLFHLKLLLSIINYFTLDDSLPSPGVNPFEGSPM
jgi:hypothetical protein